MIKVEFVLKIIFFVGFIVNDKNNFSSYVFSYYESVIINVNYFIRTDNDVNHIKKIIFYLL